MTDTPDAERPPTAGEPPTSLPPAPPAAQPAAPDTPRTHAAPDTAPAAPFEPLPPGPAQPLPAQPTTGQPTAAMPPAPAGASPRHAAAPEPSAPRSAEPVPDPDEPRDTAPTAVEPGGPPPGSSRDDADETAEAEADEVALAAGAGEEPPRRGRGRLVALTLLTLAGLVATAVLAVMLYQRDRDDEREAAALEAAQRLAGYLTTYDSDSLDEDFERVAAHATGDFAEDFEAESARVRPTIEQFKVSADGEVREAAVQSLSRDGKMATVLIFLDQQVRTSASPDPRTDKNRIVMTVQRLRGEWYISRVRVL